MERQIGETFTINNRVVIKVSLDTGVRKHTSRCNNCFYRGSVCTLPQVRSEIGECSSGHRTDKVNVYFTIDTQLSDELYHNRNKKKV